MFGINRDRLGRFAKHSFTRKVLKLAVLTGITWFVFHMFFSLYTIQHSRGIYGVVSKTTFNAMVEDHAKAQAWDTTPTPDYKAMYGN